MALGSVIIGGTVDGDELVVHPGNPPIEILSLFGRFGREQRLPLRDPKSLENFADLVKADVAQALSNDALLHGQRTQNMFEALVVSLGQYELLKVEDTGLVHPKGKYIAPDFRVILNDGTQWLIEVKNVYDPEPRRQRARLRSSDISRLADYAKMMNCALKLAIYWARWGLWTLIDPSDLQPDGSKLSINMFNAMRVNEFARLGDRTIGTIPPLTFRLLTDKAKPHTLSPDGEFEFWIGDVAILSGDSVLTDVAEQSIAWKFMLYGDWDCSGPQAVLSGEEVDAIEFIWTPRERANEPQNFEMIGTLSAMFSRYYAEQTLAAHGMIQTEAEHIPDWFAPLLAVGYERKVLPLWRFVLQKNRRDSAEKLSA